MLFLYKESILSWSSYGSLHIYFISNRGEGSRLEKSAIFRDIPFYLATLHRCPGLFMVHRCHHYTRPGVDTVKILRYVCDITADKATILPLL
jgi:hypothetical protein